MKKITLISLFILSIISCKKKETTQDTPPVTNTTTPASGYNGVLRSYKLDYSSSGTITASAYASDVFFSNQSILLDDYDLFLYAPYLNAGPISLNGTILAVNNVTTPVISYNDSTFTNFGPTYNWNVTGGSSVPQFSCTFSAPLPTYTGISAVAGSTITLSQTNTLSLTGITGADEIEVMIGGGSGYAIKTAPGTATSVTFSSSELTSTSHSLTPSSSGNITVMCYKVDYKTVGAKKYKIKIGYLITDYIVVQ